MILALAAYLKRTMYQFDVKSTFLNSELQEELYIAQLEGFTVKGKEEKVYKLRKALYGLKQAPRAWYNKIDTYFLQNGFERSKNESNLYATPMNFNEKLQVNDGTEPADARSFRSLVGGLIYLINMQPDISFTVRVISRFMHCPSKHHFGAAKRVLRYIARTVDFGIWYGHVSEFKLFGYTDSDWAGCLEDRRSTSSYVFSLGSAVVC
ncbi:uncharacterized mitochondrial protein AtMg00810-like [Hevea brasiliensis]|uniref:uncharacterized mitochondrial protein AtMg00810-like n=1 Tax=Hevea brasiliensis TaxID=3981 RepID=UPI0025F4CA8D|nr:uncharacterized mitochondrial protein AtMg00810-like [Hevea brasiliensis]